MNVEDLMSREVVTLHAESVLVDAEEIMGLRRFRHLPVVDGPDRHLVGLVTHRDLARAAVSSLQGGHLDDQRLKAAVKVREVMHPAQTIAHDAPLHEAAARLRAGKYGCLPVVDGDELVGIVTEADFVRLTEILLRNLVGDQTVSRDQLERWLVDADQPS